MSTSTRPRASDWPGTEVRRTCLSEEAQRPSTIHLRPGGRSREPRTRISTQLFFGVTADHDATSWVRPKPGATEGEVHEPTAYVVPW